MAVKLGNAQHDYLHYANCWEDADILLEALQVQPGDSVLSIGSAGDNSFSLLMNDPEMVVAVDYNRTQLHLIELKKAAFQALDYQEFLEFLGFQKCQNRNALFQRLKIHLSEEALKFWEANFIQIEKGINHQGKFEHYFKLFRTTILPLIHSRSRVEELFAKKDEMQQQQFYQQKWNTWRWRMLFKIFFSKFIMGRFGRDPEFLKEVEVPVSEFIFSQAEKHLSSAPCQSNYFLHYILQGNFGEQLPHYARQENFEIIKNRIGRIKLFQGYAEEAGAHFGSFNKFNLSNIFEYMNQDMFRAVSAKLVKCGSPGARYVYWNLMVPRQMIDANSWLRHNRDLSEFLRKSDKGFFYSKVWVATKTR